MEQYEIEHIKKIRALSPECMVLLKADGTFPLKEAGKIALYGCGARQTVKGGTGSGDVNCRHFSTVEEGLENAGFEITTKAWLDAYDQAKKEAEEAYLASVRSRVATLGLAAALMPGGSAKTEPEYEFPLNGECDTAIYVLSRNAGEGGDRAAEKGDVLLSDTEVRDILAAAEKYSRFLLALNVSNVVDLSPVIGKVGNILLMSQTGMTVGDSFADVLLGKAYPSGKLATTWARWEDYSTVGDFGDPHDTRYREGIYVGYRWFDAADITPVFPFGFGLGYTSFELAEKQVSVIGSQVTVQVCVKNTGAFAGKEVAQVYVSLPEGRLDQPVKTLAAFQKTEELKPNEAQELTLSFDLRDLASFDAESACTILEKGDYIVFLGNASDSLSAVAVIKLKETSVVRRLSHSGGTPDFADWKPEKRVREIPEGLPVFTASIQEISLPDRHVVSGEAKTLASRMTDAELAFLCVGGFRNEGQRHFIGNSDMLVAGAAGQTTERVESYGVPPVVMGDGPAGLRLSREYIVNDEGIHSLDNGVMDSLEAMLPEAALKALGIDTNRPQPVGEKHEQNCSAIPVGTALAQSWNPEVCEACGDLVGDEMERFGIDLWLAPALNIHRSILCGRNFEYYSEDPLISGKMAAAVTRGVQKHAGKGVTIKHFCCNNQETNRFYSNSQVSQRALRDLYLKGFELAVREEMPMALMTSYNLLNGVHTSQRRDLIDTVLRGEWGYTGIVMSDWVTPGDLKPELHLHPGAHTAAAIGAGNDIMMPGTGDDHKILMDALNDPEAKYPLTRTQLEENAARIIDMALTVKRSKQ